MFHNIQYSNISNIMKKERDSNLSGWKPLKLEGSIFFGNVDGLIGIEELSGYKLEDGNKKKNILIPSGKHKKEKSKVLLKRKPSDNWQENDIDTNEPLLKKIKVSIPKDKKQKRIRCKKVSKAPVFKNHLEIVDGSKNKISSESINYENSVYDPDVQQWTVLGVSSPIIKALKEQKFYHPTLIQSLSLPPAIFGYRDILGAAETGSGKTLAFGIPILNGILELKSKKLNKANGEPMKKDINIGNKGWICSEYTVEENDRNSSKLDCEEQIESIKKNGIGCVRVIHNVKMDNVQNSAIKPLYALILTPTRELAIQIKDHLTKVAKYTDIEIAVLLGGMAAVKQERILNKGPDVVIATPGRLWELIQQGNQHLSQVDSIQYLAIDETDRMLEKGHFQELHQLLEKININEKKVKERQTFVFSATLTMVHEIPEYLEKKRKMGRKNKIQKLTPGQKLQKIMKLVGIKHPKIVDVTKESGTTSNLTECRIACTIDHKDYYLYYFLQRHAGRTLVFCNSIGCVKRLATLFGILGCRPLALHASMQQKQRLKSLERFQADENGLLIATDVAARGLDIPNVEHVIHYQVPRTSESYVHRSGRTARAEKEGITVLIMEPSEKHYYSKLCKTLGRTQDLPTFPVVDRLLIAVKERVDAAREIDKLDLKCRRDNSQKSWLRKAVEDMDLVLDEDEEELEMETNEEAGLKHRLKAKKRQLASLMSKPLFPKGFSGKYPDLNIEITLKEDNQKAVEVMKKVITDMPKEKKNRKKRLKSKNDSS